MTSYVEIERIPPNLIRLSISLEIFAFIFNVGIFFFSLLHRTIGRKAGKITSNICCSSRLRSWFEVYPAVNMNLFFWHDILSLLCPFMETAFFLSLTVSARLSICT